MVSFPIRGIPIFLRMRSSGIEASVGTKRKRPPNLVRKDRGTQVQLSNVGDIGRGRPRPGWALVVGAAWQSREPFVLENLCHGDRAEGIPLMGQVAADVVNGEVLFAQVNDTLPEGIGLGCGLGSFGRGEKEVPLMVLAELVDQDSEASRGVTKAPSNFGAGGSINKKGAEGLVLAVGGVSWFKEDLRQVC